MKKNLIFLSLITVSLLVTSCFSSGSGDRKELRDRLKEILDEEQEEVEMENVEINGLYSMDVPEHMTVSLTMNDDASLQYMNETRNEYIIVIDEDKEEFKTIFQALGMYDDDLSLIENYAISQESFTMDAATSVLDEEDIEKIKIGRYPARRKNFDAKVAGVLVPIAYSLAFIEGEDNLYMIMAWTSKSKRDDYEETVSKMFKSFREL